MNTLIQDLRQRAAQAARDRQLIAEVECFRMSRKQGSTFLDDARFVRQLTRGWR
jgi:hypothetical protein